MTAVFSCLRQENLVRSHDTCREMEYNSSGVVNPDNSYHYSSTNHVPSPVSYQKFSLSAKPNLSPGAPKCSGLALRLVMIFPRPLPKPSTKHFVLLPDSVAIEAAPVIHHPKLRGSIVARKAPRRSQSAPARRPVQFFSNLSKLNLQLLPDRISCLPYFRYRHKKLPGVLADDNVDACGKAKQRVESSESKPNPGPRTPPEIAASGKISDQSGVSQQYSASHFHKFFKQLSSYSYIIMVLLNYYHPARFCHHYVCFRNNHIHQYRHQQQQQEHINYHGQHRLPYNFMYCMYCALYWNGYLELQEYAKQQEAKHRRKIILPCVIPWEYGSNKYASQKGTGGFGTIRNATTTIKSSRQLSESNDGVVPWMNCPQLRDKELASQAGLTPFGGIREHAIKVLDKDGEKKKDISKIVGDQASEGILKIWSQPNPDAKNDQPFGKHRDAIMEVKGGRRFSQKELNASRAAIPRFQDPRETIAAKAQKAYDARATGLINNRQTITPVEGLNRTEQDVLDSNRYMAWIGGQLTLQSQSHTGGFQKPRDVVSTSYFDRVMSEREFLTRKVKQLEKSRQEQRDKENRKKKDWFTLDGRERRIEDEVTGEEGKVDGNVCDKIDNDVNDKTKIDDANDEHGRIVNINDRKEN